MGNNEKTIYCPSCSTSVVFNYVTANYVRYNQDYDCVMLECPHCHKLIRVTLICELKSLPNPVREIVKSVLPKTPMSEKEIIPYINTALLELIEVSQTFVQKGKLKSIDEDEIEFGSDQTPGSKRMYCSVCSLEITKDNALQHMNAEHKTEIVNTIIKCISEDKISKEDVEKVEEEVNNE